VTARTRSFALTLTGGLVALATAGSLTAAAPAVASAQPAAAALTRRRQLLSSM